jgi:N-acetylglucosaminyldiphosphoundecaprenol N-acetyl-beta-D-mannosaminyltransferase
VDVLGTVLDTPTLAGAAANVTAQARTGGPGMIVHRDAHGLLWARRDPAVRAAERAATLVLPDGMPLVWLARIAGARDAERVYGPDLMAAVMAGPALRHALIGGAPGVADRLAEILAATFPHQRIVGTLCPVVTAPTMPDTALGAAVDAMGADVAWISLGTPKQDLWMATHRPILRTAVLVGCGAAFGVLAGMVPQAPPWMRRSGLEWLFRLLCEPRRLAGRYGRTVPLFAVLALGWCLRRAASRASSYTASKADTPPADTLS